MFTSLKRQLFLPGKIVSRHNYIGWLTISFFSIAPHLLKAQSLSGFVLDKETGEPLIGVNIKNKTSRQFSASNTYGFYSVKLSDCPCEVEFSSVGYKKFTYTLEANKDISKNIELVLESHLLNEVTVKADQVPISKMPLGVTSIPVARLKQVPVLFGETDILKSLMLTPGVAGTVEGTAGILVRGGSPDQNLILLDETVVYNVSHLFGLVSVFNPDAIKDVKLYKASFPARYGGRLSSVIDITTKNGNSKERNMELGIGLINSRFLWEGPLKKDKDNGTNFLIAARTSNLSLLLLPTYIGYLSSNGGQYVNYNLYDVNLKLNKQFKDKSQLFFSTYTGNDIWFVRAREGGDFNNKYQLNWGNLTSSLRYIKPLGQKVFFKTTAAYTRYKYGIGLSTFKGRTKTDFLNSSSQIQDGVLKSAIEFYPDNKNEIFAGGEITLHGYQPVDLRGSFFEENNVKNQRIRATEKAGYVEWNNQILPFASLQTGIRFAGFSVQDTSFTSLEPRGSLNINFSKNTSLKIGYSRMKQFLHLVNNNSAGLPNDLWIPATRKVLPQQSDQLAASIASQFSPTIGVSIDAYYKRYSNLVEYKLGSNVLVNNQTPYEELLLTRGIGESYGFELFADKSKGKFTGWLAYTLAWNFRAFRELNDGRFFPANFDRRHNFAVTGNYIFNERINLSASWIYQSGTPVTVPKAVYKIPFRDTSIPTPEFIYGDKNNFRLPDYHRLDFSVNFTGETRKGRERTWTFGVYNAYNRVNPFYLRNDHRSIMQSPNSRTSVGWDLSVTRNAILPFLPFVNYSIKL